MKQCLSITVDQQRDGLQQLMTRSASSACIWLLQQQLLMMHTRLRQGTAAQAVMSINRDAGICEPTSHHPDELTWQGRAARQAELPLLPLLPLVHTGLCLSPS